MARVSAGCNRAANEENATKCYQVAAFGPPLVEAEAPAPTGTEALLEVVAAGGPAMAVIDFVGSAETAGLTPAL
jgi:hypothetical protein